MQKNRKEAKTSELFSSLKTAKNLTKEAELQCPKLHLWLFERIVWASVFNFLHCFTFGFHRSCHSGSRKLNPIRYFLPFKGLPSRTRWLNMKTFQPAACTCLTLLYFGSRVQRRCSSSRRSWRCRTWMHHRAEQRTRCWNKTVFIVVYI